MTDSNERKREYLLRYLRAIHRVNRAELDLRQTSAIGPSAIIYDDMPHGSPDLNGLERIAIQADRQLADLNRAEADAARIHDEILRQAVTEKVILCTPNPFGKKEYLLPTPAPTQQDLPF